MPSYPIYICMGDLLNSLIAASLSACFLWSNAWREVSSKYPLNLSINAVFSAVAAVIKSPEFKDISLLGIGIVA